MASLYCEVCGVEIRNVKDAKRLRDWTHREAKKPVTCITHRGASLYDSGKLKFDPLTGKSSKK